jgi:arsenite-transporting ATPase
MDRIRRTTARGKPVRIVPATLDEPRGIAALRKLGRQLEAETTPDRRPPRAAAHAAAKPAPSLSRSPRAAADSIAAFRGARLLFFGGKGGVGKTTVSAAVAIRLAAANPRVPVLLLSTDPAHSLADVLDAPAGDTASRVRGAPRNLYVRELDAPAALAARRADLERALADIVIGLAGGGGGAAADTAVTRLMDHPPPGIDELFGMLTVVESQREYPLIVVDTAPTGHALRLLEMPDAAREWVQVLLRMLLKYRSVVKPGPFAAELVELSKTIRALQDLMHDREATRFIVVTRATDVTRLETDRLLDELKALKLAAPAIVANAMTLGPGTCGWCRATARLERRRLRPLRERCGKARCAIIQTPLTAPPPRGAAALDRWARTWMTER